MKSSLARSFALLTLVLAATACGEVTNPADDDDDVVDASADASQGPDAAPDAMVDPCRAADVSLEDFWACMRTGVCELLSRCYGAGVGVEQCEMANIFIFDSIPFAVSEVLFSEAIANGTMTYDGTRVAACLENLESLSCTELFGSENPFTSCGIFTGGVPTNGECFTESQCENVGAECVEEAGCTDSTCCIGTCQGPTPLGGDCSSIDCAPGDHCVSGVCRTGTNGAQCSSDFTCDRDHYCDPAGLCRPDFGDGATCTDDDQCTLPNQCLGLGLDGATMGTCAPSASPGDECDGDCLSLKMWCDQPDPTQLGTCRDVPLPGESCEASQTCGAFIECEPTELVCLERGDVGATCSDGFSDCKLSLFCDNDITGQPTGQCTAPQGAGLACTNGDQCLSAVCTDGACVDFQGCN